VEHCHCDPALVQIPDTHHDPQGRLLLLLDES
jgi:hypothetical protein